MGRNSKGFSFADGVPFSSEHVGPAEVGIYAKLQDETLDELRQLWRQTRLAEIEARTAFIGVKLIQSHLKDMAERIKDGRLSPEDSFTIFGPMTDETISDIAGAVSELERDAPGAHGQESQRRADAKRTSGASQ